MSSEIFLDQVEQNLVALINEKKYRLAHDKCLSWMQKFPEEDRFLKLKKRIESEVEDQNADYIESEIDKAKALMNVDKYAEAIKGLKPLLKLTKDTSKIECLIAKSQGKYQSKAKEAQDVFEKIQRERLGKMFAENPDTLLAQLFMLERENPGHKLVLKLTAEFREKVIEKKIKDKSELINSGKYDDINHLIKELEKIDKNSPQIAVVRDRIKVRQHETQVSQQREHLYESQKQLITLMQLEKFDKAIKVAKEILSLDPSNKAVAKVLKTAHNKFFNQTKEETIKNIELEATKLKAQYDADRESFVKV